MFRRDLNATRARRCEIAQKMEKAMPVVSCVRERQSSWDDHPLAARCLAIQGLDRLLDTGSKDVVFGITDNPSQSIAVIPEVRGEFLRATVLVEPILRRFAPYHLVWPQQATLIERWEHYCFGYVVVTLDLKRPQLLECESYQMTAQFEEKLAVPEIAEAHKGSFHLFDYVADAHHYLRSAAYPREWQLSDQAMRLYETDSYIP